jgi:poly(hydroxyalkanoate) granule-associated protein
VAKLKKSVLKKSVRSRPSAAKPAAGRSATGKSVGAADLQQRAEHLSRSLVESAQQIWMAGVGAFTRAQGEGSKLFEALVTEGMNIEKTTRKLAGGRVEAVRDAVEDRVGAVRGRASDTWDRLENVFEDRVQRALNRLGIPGREDLVALSSRVDALSAQLRKTGTPAPRPAKAASKSRTASPASATRAAKPKQVAKAARRPAATSKRSGRSRPKAARPVAPQS